MTQQEQENEALIRRWVEEVWNQKRPEVIEELCAPDVRAHGMGPNGTVLQGPGAFRGAYDAFTEAFPDVQIAIDQLVAGGDLVSCHLTCRGTHKGHSLGVPPSGRSVTFPVMTMARIREGRIIEGWNVLDLLTVMQQVEAVPKESLAALP